MLKIKDKSGKLKFVWKDSEEAPISIDDLIAEEARRAEEKKNETDDGLPGK